MQAETQSLKPEQEFVPKTRGKSSKDTLRAVSILDSSQRMWKRLVSQKGPTRWHQLATGTYWYGEGPALEWPVGRQKAACSGKQWDS